MDESCRKHTPDDRIFLSVSIGVSVGVGISHVTQRLFLLCLLVGQVPVKKIFLWTTIISAPLGLLSLLLITHTNRSLGIPDGAFVLGDDVVLGILGEIAFLPTLVLAARLCPPGVEAALFATLMSIYNASSTVGSEFGALLTKLLGVTESNFDNLGLLTVICNLTSLWPLLIIGLLDEAGIGDESEADMEG